MLSSRPLAARLLLPVLPLVVVTAGVGASSASAGTPEPRAVAAAGGGYVALGDSFSSGESVRPYAWRSDSAINGCHRSTQAYPARLARTRAAGMTFDFGACSGAVTEDLYRRNHNGNRTAQDAVEPAQLRRLGNGTRAVSLTIGGNDIGFGQILRSCIHADRRGKARTNCSSGPLRAQVDARIAALAGRRPGTTSPEGTAITPLATVLRDVKARAPHALVVVGTYPHVVASRFSRAECTVGSATVVENPRTRVPLRLSKKDAAWMVAVTNSLDGVIRSAARQAGVPVRVAEARTQLAHHALCDAQASWIAPATGRVSVKTGALTLDSSSLHPTEAGHRAYARAFAVAG